MNKKYDIPKELEISINHDLSSLSECKSGCRDFPLLGTLEHSLTNQLMFCTGFEKV